MSSRVSLGFCMGSFIILGFFTVSVRVSLGFHLGFSPFFLRVSFEVSLKVSLKHRFGLL